MKDWSNWAISKTDAIVLCILSVIVGVMLGTILNMLTSDEPVQESPSQSHQTRNQATPRIMASSVTIQPISDDFRADPGPLKANVSGFTDIESVLFPEAVLDFIVNQGCADLIQETMEYGGTESEIAAKKEMLVQQMRLPTRYMVHRLGYGGDTTLDSRSSAVNWQGVIQGAVNRLSDSGNDSQECLDDGARMERFKLAMEGSPRLWQWRNTAVGKFHKCERAGELSEVSSGHSEAEELACQSLRMWVPNYWVALQAPK